METLKFGCIGCGGMGRVHCNHAKQIEGIEVVAYCDLIPARAEAYLNEFGGWYAAEDAEKIFADERIDAVLIQTGEKQHPALGIKAAKGGKHIFMEKPIARSLREADALVEAVKTAGVKYQIGFCFRFSPTVERAKQLLPNPAYSVCQCAATLTGQACHNIDLIVHKFHQSSLVSIYASGGSFFGFDTHLEVDSFAAVFRFEDGSTSSYVQHGVLNPVLNKFQFQLFGKEGCVYLADRYREVHWCPASSANGERSAPYRDEKTYMGHFQELEDFVRCIREDKEPRCTVEQGRYVLAIEKGIIRSAVTGKVVEAKHI